MEAIEAKAIEYHQVGESLLQELSESCDLEKLRGSVAGRAVLVFGAGDVVFKKIPWLVVLKDLGVDVYISDIRNNTKQLPWLNNYIKEFVYSERGALISSRLRKIARQQPFMLMDISTWPDSHILTAYAYQDIADLIVTTKPIDSSSEVLRRMYNHKTDPDCRDLLEKLVVHDHYSDRSVIELAAERMPKWLSDHGALREIQIFIIEAKSVAQETDRIEALSGGIALDLVPHALRVLKRLLPTGDSWQPGEITFTRESLEFVVKGGARAYDVSCPINGGETETFVAVSMEGREVTRRAKANGDELPPSPDPFKILVVASKGITGQREDRDFKGIQMRFATGALVHIDLDTQRVREPDGHILTPEDGKVLHRGLNSPWIKMLPEFGVPSAAATLRRVSLFQPWMEAFEGIGLVAKASALPTWNRGAYKAREELQNLMNRIPPDLWGEHKWHMAELPAIQIGATPSQNVAP